MMPTVRRRGKACGSWVMMKARIGFIVGLWVWAGLAGGALGARMLDQCDVDSLVYDGEVIVRGVIGDTAGVKTRDGGVWVFDVTGREVMQGEVKVGRVVKVTGVEDYRKSPGMGAAGDVWDGMHHGDEVILFLTSKGRAL